MKSGKASFHSIRFKDGILAFFIYNFVYISCFEFLCLSENSLAENFFHCSSSDILDINAISSVLDSK